MNNSSTHIPNRKIIGMSRGLTLLFAISGGVAVGNLYWAQPLLKEISDSLHVSTGSAGLLVTVTQIGYAIGVLLIVPLGDTLNRRRLIPIVMAASIVALTASAFAPNFTVLLFTLAAVGLTTVTGQLLTPLAGDLSTDDQRGKVVGTVASGMLTGILISRTISGVVADAFGWRAIYLVAAILTTIMVILLVSSLPPVPPRVTVPYRKLLASVFSIVRQHRIVQLTLIMGGISFSVFTMFWTGLTFLLSSSLFSYSATKIGLVGLAGLAGAIGAQPAGLLHDKGWSMQATGIALGLALISIIIAAAGASSIYIILLAVVLIDVAIQAVNVLNQTRIFAVDANSRSRLNTAFVVSNFIGGAIGSSLAGFLWKLNAWQGLMIGCSVLITLALIVWVILRKLILNKIYE